MIGKNSQIFSPDFYGWKNQMEGTGFPLPFKIVNQRQCYIPGGISDIKAYPTAVFTSSTQRLFYFKVIRQQFASRRLNSSQTPEGES